MLKGFGIPIITGSLLPPGPGNCIFPEKSCRPGQPVRTVTLSFYLCHFVVQLENTEEVCLATGQVEGLWHSAQRCFFHGMCGRGTMQTLVDPRDVIHGKEPLL